MLDSLEHADLLRDAGHLFADELRVAASDGQVGHIHLAFQAGTRAHVDAFLAAAIAAGGTDDGAPGLRDYYHRYYAACLCDPDGNNIEAVCGAPVKRTAPHIEISREN